jgi:predicted CoA-binding protein
LRNHGHEVFAIGRDQGSVEGVEIAQAQVSLSGIDTVTLYLNPERQRDYYEYVLGLKPKRIVFNPGTENDEFEAMATKQGIEALVACTLVLLATGQY